jgi:hypothetical protein
VNQGKRFTELPPCGSSERCKGEDRKEEDGERESEEEEGGRNILVSLFLCTSRTH